jgi:hypothetical protein
VLDVAGCLTRREAERAMDQFAGAFLVPAEELRRLAGEHRRDVSLGELVELKRHFRVSLQCLVVRLGQTGILSEADSRRHWQMLREHGFLDVLSLPDCSALVCSQRPDHQLVTVDRACADTK